MSSYKQTFGIKLRHKRTRDTKGKKGEPGIGFKLTADNNYDMDNKRLTNVGEPNHDEDVINKKYFDNGLTIFQDKFIRKNENIDMNGKAIKNLSWPYENDDAVPKRYLYQNVMMLDQKNNSFIAKDKKIMNVLDPENKQDVATKNYTDSLIEQTVDKLDKIEKSLISTSTFYKLDLYDTATSYFNVIDPLHLIQVSQHMWILSGRIKPKKDILTGNDILITTLPKQFPKVPQQRYFIYFKKGAASITVAAGIINSDNLVYLYLPLKMQELIFDCILYVL